MIDDDRLVEIERIAAQMTAPMLDNHNSDWDPEATARAFETIFAAIKAA